MCFWWWENPLSYTNTPSLVGWNITALVHRKFSQIEAGIPAKTSVEKTKLNKAIVKRSYWKYIFWRTYSASKRASHSEAVVSFWKFLEPPTSPMWEHHDSPCLGWHSYKRFCKLCILNLMNNHSVPYQTDELNREKATFSLKPPQIYRREPSDRKR